MSSSDENDLHHLQLPETEHGLGLEETSHGAMNPAENMGATIGIPIDTGEFQLGSATNIDADLYLEVEHLFGSSPIFAGLEPEEIKEIVRAARKKPLQAGDILFEQDAHANAVYFIQSGEVQVRAASPTGEDIVLALLGSGTIVGELALIDGGPRSATVEALSDCDIYMLERASFDMLRRAHNPAAYKVILNLAATVDSRRRQTERRINEVFEDPAQHIELFESQVHDMLARLRKS